MESFQNEETKRTLFILFWVAIGDGAITLLSTCVHIVKFLGAGFSSPALLILAFLSIFHCMSSGMALAVSFTGYDANFIQTTIGVSIFVLLVDIISFSIRAAVDAETTDSFRIAMLIFGGFWLVFTSVQIIVLGILQFIITKWQKKLVLCIKDKCFAAKKIAKLEKMEREMEQERDEFNTVEGKTAFKKKVNGVHNDTYEKLAILQGIALDAIKQPMSDHAAKRFWALPRRVGRARRFLGTLWVVDLVLAILFLFLFTPGFVDNTFTTLISVLTLTHLFQWAWIRAVTGPGEGDMPEPGVTRADNFMLSLTRVLVTLSLVFDFLSAIFRTYGIFISPNFAGAPQFILIVGDPVSTFFSVARACVMYLFVLIGLLEFWQLQNLVTALQEHQVSPKGQKVRRVAKDYQDSILDSKSKWD